MNDHFAAAGLGRLILTGPGLVRSAARPHRPTRGAAVLRDLYQRAWILPHRRPPTKAVSQPPLDTWGGSLMVHHTRAQTAPSETAFEGGEMGQYPRPLVLWRVGREAALRAILAGSGPNLA